MKLEEIYDNLFCVGFNKRKNMCETFVRFHGHYENPNFQSKIFTKKQFDRWFKNNTEEGSDLDMDFYSLGGGFNVPDYVFNKFLEGKFDPLSEKEKKLLNEISKIKRNKFYVLAIDRTEKCRINHEIAHGLYYLNKNYKEEINKFIFDMPKRDFKKIESILKTSQIYSDERIVDEIQAHLVNDYYSFIGINILDKKGMDENKLKNYATNINKIFEKYSKNIKSIQPFQL